MPMRPVATGKSLFCESPFQRASPAAAVLEAAALALTLHDGVLPPTINQTQPDPDCDLDYVPNSARDLPVRTAVSTSFGFGGQNAALVMQRV